MSECSAHCQKLKMKRWSWVQDLQGILPYLFVCTVPHGCDRCGITTQCRWRPQSRTLKVICSNLRLWDLSQYIGGIKIVPRLREVCEERCESHVFSFTSPTSSTSHRLRNDQRGEDSSKICRCRFGVFSLWNGSDSDLILQTDSVAQSFNQLQ